jgi:hypothetical protein
MRYLKWLLALSIALSAGRAPAQQDYFASGYEGGTGNANVYRLRDLNGDGDALDVGEKTLWAEGSWSYSPNLARYGGGLLASTGSGNQILKLEDLNGDGDALDVGESVVWGNGLGYDVGSIAVAAGGAVYGTDISYNRVYKFQDLNGDGDAFDAGETSIYASTLTPHGILAGRGSIMMSVLNSVLCLRDLDSDGDALDDGEALQYTPNMLSYGAGLLWERTGGYYVADRDIGTVYRVRDLNGDGDALDLMEVMNYADNVYGGIYSPTCMAPQVGGGFLLGEYSRLSLVRDLNGDGDALDLGEVVPWADLTAPSSIVAGLGPGPAGTMITIQNGPGTLDPASPNFYSIVEQSTLDRAAVNAALNAGKNVLISTDDPASFAEGLVLQNADAQIVKSGGGAATLTIRADDTIDLKGGISGYLTVILCANDAQQRHHDLDPEAGDVKISGAIILSGELQSSGVNFDHTGPGVIDVPALTLDHTGAITLGGYAQTYTFDLRSPVGISITASGQLHGDGSVQGNLSNAGLLSIIGQSGPSSIAGSYTQAATGYLWTSINGFATYSRLDISGVANLNGTLGIGIYGMYVPQPGDSFTILTHALRMGRFAQILGYAIQPGLDFAVFYTDTSTRAIAGEMAGGTLRGAIDVPGAEFLVNGPATWTGAFDKYGPGVMILSGGQVWQSDASACVQSGTLRFDLGPAEPVSVSPGSSLAVAAGAQLELAGSQSGLSDGANHVEILNNGMIFVAGDAPLIVGAITGAGNTQLNDFAELTVESISQNTVRINAGAKLTIAPIPGGPLASFAHTNPVPEPSIWLLLVPGMMGLLVWRLSGRGW